jgi:hypothetical protein
VEATDVPVHTAFVFEGVGTGRLVGVIVGAAEVAELEVIAVVVIVITEHHVDGHRVMTVIGVLRTFVFMRDGIADEVVVIVVGPVHDLHVAWCVGMNVRRFDVAVGSMPNGVTADVLTLVGLGVGGAE